MKDLQLLAPSPASPRVGDLGAGSGDTICELAKLSSFDASLFDFSLAAIAEAKAQGYNAYTANLRFPLQAPNSQYGFDLVILSGTLEFLPEFPILETVRKLLFPPEAKAVIVVGGVEAKDRLKDSPEPLRYYTEETLREVLTKYRLEVTHLLELNGWFGAVATV